MVSSPCSYLLPWKTCLRCLKISLRCSTLHSTLVALLWKLILKSKVLVMANRHNFFLTVTYCFVSYKLYRISSRHIRKRTFASMSCGYREYVCNGQVIYSKSSSSMFSYRESAARGVRQPTSAPRSSICKWRPQIVGSIYTMPSKYDAARRTPVHDLPFAAYVIV